MSTKLNWSREEQAYLLQMKQSLGGNYWSQIAKALNNRFPNRRRNGKQCRQRYINFVKVNQVHLENKEWGLEEVRTLFQIFNQQGTKWTEISKVLPGRSENCVKNKFYCEVRKLIRNINNLMLANKHLEKKQVKLESILRILNFCSDFAEAPQEMLEQIAGLKKKILMMLTENDRQFPQEELTQVADKVRKLNWEYRYFFMKGSHKKSTGASQQQKQKISYAKKTTLDQDGNSSFFEKPNPGVQQNVPNSPEKKSRQSSQKVLIQLQASEIELLSDEEIQKCVEEYCQDHKPILPDFDRELDEMILWS